MANRKKNAANYRIRRILAVIAGCLATIAYLFFSPSSYEDIYEVISSKSEDVPADAGYLEPKGVSSEESEPVIKLAIDYLEKLSIKGRAPKTGYAREKFYDTWPKIEGCSLRQKIIKREFGDSAVVSTDDNCTIISGEYNEPYTGSHLIFYQKKDISSKIQIDHIVPLSDAWQKGAQNLSEEERYEFATDPLNLLAVDSDTNMKKSNGDAATWLPPNKTFRCQYIARQISVKYKYNLWITQAEYEAMKNILNSCPKEPVVGV